MLNKANRLGNGNQISVQLFSFLGLQAYSWGLPQLTCPICLLTLQLSRKGSGDSLGCTQSFREQKALLDFMLILNLLTKVAHFILFFGDILFYIRKRKMISPLLTLAPRDMKKDISLYDR